MKCLKGPRFNATFTKVSSMNSIVSFRQVFQLKFWKHLYCFPFCTPQSPRLNNLGYIKGSFVGKDPLPHYHLNQL